MSGPDAIRRLGPAASMFLARAAALMAGVAAVLIASHALGPDGRGRVATFAVAQFLGSAVLGIGTASAAYLVTRRRELAARTVTGALAVWAGMLVPIVAALLGVIAVAHGQGLIAIAPPGRLVSVLLAAGIAGQFLAAGLTGVAMGTGRVGPSALGFAAPPVAAFLGTCLSAWFGAPLQAYLVVQAMSYVATAAALLVALGRPTVPTRRDLGILFGVGRAAVAGDISNALSYRLDVLVLGALATTEAVGIYSLAVQVLEPVWIIATAGSSGLLITLAREHSGSWGDQASTMAKRVVTLTLAGVALVLIAMPVLVEMVGPSFAPAEQAGLLLAPGIVALSGSKVLAATHTAAGRLWLGSVIATMAVLITTAFDLLLIPALGPLGAALASTIGYTASLALWVTATRKFGTQPAERTA